MSHAHADTLPQGALTIAAGLVLFTLAATAIVRFGHIQPSASPVLLRAEEKVAPVAARSLRFLDRADGAVVIQDASTGRIAEIIAPGQKTGFIRGVMRGLARDRKMRGIGDRPPFTLTAWRDGELSLVDTATGRNIELTAFGSTNRQAFAELLP